MIIINKYINLNKNWKVPKLKFLWKIVYLKKKYLKILKIKNKHTMYTLFIDKYM